MATGAQFHGIGREPRCRTFDAGLFLAFCTAPMGREHEFYETVVCKGLFAPYKRAVEQHFPSQADSTEPARTFREVLYVPNAYFMFGRFDLLIISLIDDFEFGLRTFGPYDPMCDAGNDPRLLSFSHQVILGPIPRLGQHDDLRRLTRNPPFTDNPSQPLLAVCQLKLNATSFLGGGLDYVHYVITGLRAVFESCATQVRPMGLLVAESYSWHELTILLTGSSYAQMAQCVLKIRELRFRDLIAAVSTWYGMHPSSDGTAAAIDFMAQKRLVAVAARSAARFRQTDPGEAHVFESSATTLGVSLQTYLAVEAGVASGEHTDLLASLAEDELAVFSRWFTKAGHFQHALDLLGAAERSPALGCPGRGDFVFPQPTRITTPEFLRQIVSLRQTARDSSDIRASSTTIALPVRERLQTFDEQHHAHTSQLIIPELLIAPARITQLDRDLTAAGIPKTVAERVENMVANFNDGLSDPSLFGYFIELHPVMTWMLQEAACWASQSKEHESIEDRSNTLSALVSAWEVAYKNRFYSGYRMSEVTDFNLEFKGALQQAISAFDAAFKAIISAVTPNTRPEHVFSVVGGAPWVSTHDNSLLLNYLHVSQPEFFASFIGHEAGFYEADHGYGEHFTLGARETQKFVTLFSKRPLDRVLRTLGRLTEPELFSYVATDLTAFHLSYFGDGDLFRFWYWGHWYTLPGSHRGVDDIDELRFVAMLLRVTCVLELTGNGHQDSLPEAQSDDVFGRLRSVWSEPTRRYVKAMWREESFERWGQRALVSAQERLLALGDKEALGNGWQEVGRNLREVSGTMTELLSAGSPVHYDAPGMIGRAAPAAHALALLHAYLAWMRGKCGASDVFLRRSKGTGRILEIGGGAAPFIFDPRGGTFTHDPAVRREYFRFRVALLLSLLDLSAIEKREWVMERLAEAERKSNPLASPTG